MVKKKGLTNVLDNLIDKYSTYMGIPDMKERLKIFADGIALSLPLLAAFSWYASLIFRSISSAEDVHLSPLKTEPIIVFILVFIVAYSVFLMFEYNLLRKRLEKVKK